jgi:hypothetical protein
LSNFTRPNWNAAISSTRISAFFIAVPVVRVGGRRNPSMREYRLPSGVFSNATRSPGRAASARRAALATVMFSRSSAIWRTSATCRASTETPGSSTRLRRSQPTAWSNNAFGPSECAVHARACKNPLNFRPHS